MLNHGSRGAGREQLSIAGETGYLTTAEVAQRYRTAEATVRYWRMIDYGPRGVKVGRRVLYPADEIARFDAELRALAEQRTEGA